jgi:hypothetical protein
LLHNNPLFDDSAKIHIRLPSKPLILLLTNNTSSSGHRDRRRRPYAFTEHGAITAANILNGARAVQMSVFVVRAFLKMRALFGDKRELAQKLARWKRN